MKDKKKKGRGRPKFEGGARIVINLTAPLVEALRKKQMENPKLKRAKIIRNALSAYLLPPGKRREQDEL
ncbi:MAG TPA: hypothetical protein VHE12_01680 [bacterium]|nr:hypothetical protein [bacterium]